MNGFYLLYDIENIIYREYNVRKRIVERFSMDLRNEGERILGLFGENGEVGGIVFVWEECVVEL